MKEERKKKKRNNAKFSGHYVRQCMHNVCVHACVGSGCPIPSIFWETGSIRMKYMILQRKLIFLHHVATLPETALARQVYEVLTRLTLPGLVDDCQEFRINFGITQMDKFSKGQRKTMIKKHIRKLNKDEILTDIKN